MSMPSKMMQLKNMLSAKMCSTYFVSYSISTDFVFSTGEVFSMNRAFSRKKVLSIKTEVAWNK